ncbi:MAG: hypothetical protein IBX68_03415 [Dehalococcoidia bacterium]|nr:hypothetical protein [Dehalococcoidia bacterium]
MRYVFVLLLAPLMLLLLPVALVWYINGAGIYQLLRSRTSALACGVNADCPEGHVCVDGRCIPASS